MNFSEIEQKVIEWAEQRDIYEESDEYYQAEKLQEELDELKQAIHDGDDEPIVDAIGDMLVVLTNIAHFIGVDLTHCYDHAYYEIKDRRGRMVAGKFVKE